MIVGSAQLENIDSVADHILGLATAVDHENLIVKVGDGAPLIRDRIINQLILSGIQCILVNEKNTSRGSRTKAHIHAATRIAIMEEKIFQLRKLEPTNGDLKENTKTVKDSKSW